MLAAAGQVSSLSVAEASSSDAAEWDEFVRSRADATFCHLWAWSAFFGDCFSHRSRYLIARGEDGRVEGVLPLIQMISKLGRFLVSMPYLNYGGPLGSERAQEALTAHARSLAEPAPSRKLELRSRQPAAGGLAPGRNKVTVVMPLPDTVEELWQKTFRAKLRSQIRRAQKEQMEIRFGAEQRPAFYRVFSRNMRDLGTPVLPRAFFEGLQRHFPDEVVFGTVYSDDEPVAAGCGFVFNGEFEMTWASSLREHNAKAPNMLLYSGFMEGMIRRDVAIFNFGRCTPGGGTHRFKLQWGAQDEALHWTGWPANPAADDGPGAALQLASRIWQRLPLPVAEALGPIVAARLPQF